MSHATKTLLVVSSAAVMATVDLYAVNIAFPAIRSEWPGTSVATVSWVLNAYAIVFAALLVPWGRLADRFGRRRAFLAGVVTFTAASALCAAASSIEFLIAARVLQAVGGAVLMPTSLALLLDASPPERRPAAISIWAAIGGVAAAAGPPLGGLLAEADWRWIFMVNLPVGVVAVLGTLAVVSESRDEGKQVLPDILGTVLLAASIGALALGLVKAPDWGWGDPRVLGSFAGALIGVALFFARSASHPAPVVELSLLRVRSFALANVALVLFFSAFGAMVLATVLFLTQVWDDSAIRAGLSLAPAPAMTALASRPGAALAARIGAGRVATLGSLTFAVGCAWWHWRGETAHEYASAMLPGLILTGSGVGLVLATLASAAVASLPPGRLATGSAVVSMSRQIGAAVGVAGFVAIFGNPAPADEIRAFEDAWLFMAVVAGGAAVTSSVLSREPRTRNER